MSFLSDNSLPQEALRNLAFKLVVQVRDAFSIAYRKAQPIPYHKSIEYIGDLDGDLFSDIKELLVYRNESSSVKYYKELAEAEQENGNNVTPVDLIKLEMDSLSNLLRNDSESDGRSHLISKLKELKATLAHFDETVYSEDYILHHDFTVNDLHPFFENDYYQDAKTKDYKLSDNRKLRVRLLHPDKAERIIGSDLVYEQFDLARNKVRFIHLQYKTWDNKRLYFSEGNLLDQMDKLELNFCKSGHCQNNRGERNSPQYRFPFCSAFIRPTTNHTRPDSRMVSTGVHIPMCMAREIQTESKRIDTDNILNRSIGHNLFDRLFINNHLGSRWMDIAELESFYASKGLNEIANTLRIHTQEIIPIKDSDVYRDIG